jgi:hypothetical protein
MWTIENRHRYDRDGLRYPSDLTDAEWGLVEPLTPPPNGVAASALSTCAR